MQFNIKSGECEKNKMKKQWQKETLVIKNNAQEQCKNLDKEIEGLKSERGLLRYQLERK